MANLVSAPADVPTRTRVDACPGALTVHAAADGGLARVRLPGGAITAAALRTVATAATELGDGRVELTSRGNLQLRGLADGAEVELGARLAAAGLLPSATHERVRNIVASPLAGLDRRPDVLGVDGLVAELDRGLCADPRLAALPGRFLFAVDDGRGDVAALGADVLVAPASGGSEAPGIASITVNGMPAAEPAAVVPLALAVAAAFLAERADRTPETGSTAWRLAELGPAADGTPGPDAVLRRVRRDRPELVGPPALSVPTVLSEPSTLPEPVGPVVDATGRVALVVLAPLGRLDAAQLEALAAAAGASPLRITPWRSVVLPSVADPIAAGRELATLGLGVDAASPWYGVSACTGRPGCAKARADVQADAAATVRSGIALSGVTVPAGRTVHWSGCERRCGRGVHTEIDIVATPTGYLTMPVVGAR